MCENCYHYDDAEIEAKDKGYRFTPIGTGLTENGYYDQRCMCGAVMHARLGFCVQCSRDTRMLEAKAKEARLLNKILTDLRREIRTQKKLTDEGNAPCNQTN